METIVDFFRGHPLIPLFLTVGLGFWLGRQRFKGFSMGGVAATLIVGVIIGQMKIVIPDMVKTIFFLFFLFSIGYSVGPQFFRSFRGAGTKMVLFSIVEALICAATVWIAARVMGYNNGVATGLYAGSQTASACLGMVGDTVREMPLDQDKREYLLMIIPACYAVTYVFGTLGSAWFLSVIGPKMLGGLTKVREDCARQEEALDGGTDAVSPGDIRAGRPVVFRAFLTESDLFSSPLSVSDLEQRLAADGNRIMIERVRHESQTCDITPQTTICKGDTIVIAGRKEAVVGCGTEIGKEVVDPELLNFSARKTPVTVSNHGAAGMTLGELRGMKFMNGILIASVKRNGMSLPVRNRTILDPGDVITIVGFPRGVALAASKIGYADPESNITDMVFVGLGIAMGCLIGSLAINFKGLPLSLGVSVGTLIAGLCLGWLRNRRPTFGHIPSSASWLMSNLGVNMFIGIIGLTAGAHFLHGLREAGWWIFLVGAICTLLTLIIGILLGKKVFRFTSPEILGCVAGSRCAVAAIGAVLDKLESDVPNLAYTISYAVANVALVFSSLLVLFLV